MRASRLTPGRDRRRNRALAAQLPLVADVLAAHVRAGRSLAQAIAAAAADLSEPAGAALARAGAAVALGASAADALAELGDTPDVAYLRAAVAMQLLSGGDIALLLGRMAGSLRDRADARREADLATAQARATGRIVTALPPLALGALWLADPAAAGLLVTSPPGWVALAGSGGLAALGHLLIGRIADVG